MADVDTSYGTKTVITITLASLADTSSRASTSWDMSVGNQIDEFVMVQSNGSSASNTDYGFVYVYGSLDTTSNEFTDAATGSDAAFTTANIKNSPLLGSISYNGATGVKAGPFSVASAFGGFLPAEGGLIFNNESAAALSSTAADHDLEYIALYVSSA